MRQGFGELENPLVFDFVGEVAFVKVEAGLPFLALPEAEVFHKFGGGVTEPGGDGAAEGFVGDGLGAGPGIVGVAVFLGFGEDYGDMGEDDTAFGHADALNGLKTADSEIESAVAGEADVFGSENHHPAGDKLGIFPALHHAGEIIEGGVHVGAAHGLDEGGDVVVVVVAGFVVEGHFLADSGLNHLGGDLVGEAEGELKVAEGGAGVAAGEFGDVV